MRGMNPESICKRDAVALFPVQLDVLVAPEPDKISREKCTPTVALLRGIPYRGTRGYRGYDC